MKNIKRFIVPSLFLLSIVFNACEKLPLQKGFKYTQSFYDNKIDMSVMDFMESRTDMFSGMLAAIEYVDTDPEYKDVKEMYSQPGNTYLLLHDNALINLEQEFSFFVRNPIVDTNPASPDYNIPFKGTDWSQYDKKVVADLLRYHVLKGTYDYKNLNSTAKWVDTYALSSTNDSAKVYIYLEGTRDGHLYLNNYTGVNKDWVNIKPRTPDLHAKNGVIQVMNRYLLQPTRQDIQNNK